MKSIVAAFTMVVAAGFSTPVAAEAVGTRCGCAVKAPAPSSFKQKPRKGTQAFCLVMKQSFTVSAKTPFSYYKGRWYAFCCPSCKPKFDANPARYTGR